jgi:NAD(P)H dehydrogenase (quinone)
MKVFVLGAPADQGVPLVRALLGAGHAVTAGVRRDDAMAMTPFPDLPTCHADLSDAASLAAGFAGHDALAFHLPFEFDRARAAGFGANIAQAARVTGISRIVFNTACFVADRDLGLSAHDGRRDIEAALCTSGATCRFVEPVVFMDNLIRAWSKPSIAARGIFAYPAAPGLMISWICLDDVADAMVRALEHPAAHPLHISLGGPEALTGDEAAARLSRALARPVIFKSLAPDDFAANMSELVTGSRAVTPHSIYDGMARFYRWYNDQPVSPLVVDPALSHAALGRAPTSLIDWAARQDWD